MMPEASRSFLMISSAVYQLRFMVSEMRFAHFRLS